MNIIFDMDGTLSKVGDRLSCLTESPPNWDEFYNRCSEDEPCYEIVTLASQLGKILHNSITVLTGRRESCRAATSEWLHRYDIDYDRLLMRPDNDHRHDTIVKPELLINAGIVPSIIFEDRASVVKKWRELGFICCQVAEGNF